MKKRLEEVMQVVGPPEISRINNQEGVEPLHVRDCPWCHGHHIYMVRVSRLPIASNTPPCLVERLQSRIQLIRWFDCPVTHERFRGILTLFHSPREVIRNIEVMFVTKDRKTAS